MILLKYKKRPQLEALNPARKEKKEALKMSRLKKLEPQIKEILANIPATRKDDFLLVYEVYSNYIPLAMPIGDALKHHKQLNLPSFASIIRVRRMVQTQDPSLCDNKTRDKRAEAAGDYVNYATGVDD